MSERYTLRRACPAEAPAVLSLLGEVAAWLHERGSDQWSTWRTWPQKMAPSFEEGNVWLLQRAGELSGTITMEERADPDFWTLDDMADSAAYLSKMAVRRDAAGAGLGDLLVWWARDRAHRSGIGRLRLDAWRSNQALHAYYRERGWRYIRTVDAPGRRSGVLFEIDAAPMPAAVRTLLLEVED